MLLYIQQIRHVKPQASWKSTEDSYSTTEKWERELPPLPAKQAIIGLLCLHLSPTKSSLKQLVMYLFNTPIPNITNRRQFQYEL